MLIYAHTFWNDIQSITIVASGERERSNLNCIIKISQGVTFSNK